MSGAPTFDTEKKNKQKRGEFITPPRPTGRRSNKTELTFRAKPKDLHTLASIDCELSDERSSHEKPNSVLLFQVAKSQLHLPAFLTAPTKCYKTKPYIFETNNQNLFKFYRRIVLQ